MKLAPVPAPPLAAAADKLPVDKLKAPKGFNIELYASGMPNARSLALGAKGTVFVGSRVRDKVYAIVNKDGKREVKVVASGLYRPNGVAFKNGTLYIAELSQISKIDNVDDKLDSIAEAHRHLQRSAEGRGARLEVSGHRPGQQAVFRGRPAGQQRRCMTRTTASSAASISTAAASRSSPTASATRSGSTGIRRTDELYFTDNGRDWLSEDLPNDKLNRITKLGEDFGEPILPSGQYSRLEFGWGHSCSEFVPPVALMGPHAAALGMKFYTGQDVPGRVPRPDLCRAPRLVEQDPQVRRRHCGGAARTGTASVRSVEPFITGFLELNNNYIARPVDVMNMPDGSMLISDDWNGAV